MITASQNFQNAMKAPVKVLRAKIETDEETPQVFSSADSLISYSLTANGSYFSSTTKSLEFKLIGSEFDLVDKTVSASFDVQIDAVNDTWETLNFGKFKVYEQTTDLEKEIATIKAYDQMGIFAGTLYSENILEFPTTVQHLAEQIASEYSGQLSADFANLPNATYEISEDLYEKINNTNYRDILSEIAGATASVAKISPDGTLTFLPIQHTTSEVLTYDNLKSIKFQPKYGAINSVVLARTLAEDNITVNDEQAMAENGVNELKLANNEILDDEREVVIQPIFDAVNGFYFFPFEAETEGHGWHEVGDRIRVENGENSWEIVITEVKIEVAGNLKETIKGTAPTKTETDYSRAGGIMKTIYNTEIKVDKQNQEITSVVSRMDTVDSEIAESFTNITQNIENITQTVQTTGGANMLYNSVGYATANNKPTVWIMVEDAQVSANTSPESLTFGAKSGNQINLAAATEISQTIIAGIGEPLSLSARVRKNSVGSATISLISGEKTETATISDQQEYFWEEVAIENFIPENASVTVKITTDATLDGNFAITDLMLNAGDKKVVWQQATGEILNANVLIDKDGIVVKNNIYEGDYVQITPLEFAGYSTASGSQEKVFYLSRDTTKVQKLSAQKQIEMPPIKIVPVPSGDVAGWLFVEIGGGD